MVFPDTFFVSHAFSILLAETPIFNFFICDRYFVLYSIIGGKLHSAQVKTSIVDPDPHGSAFILIG
jgi:hypothetical protein